MQSSGWVCPCFDHFAILPSSLRLNFFIALLDGAVCNWCVAIEQRVQAFFIWHALYFNHWILHVGVWLSLEGMKYPWCSKLSSMFVFNHFWISVKGCIQKREIHEKDDDARATALSVTKTRGGCFLVKEHPGILRIKALTPLRCQILYTRSNCWCCHSKIILVN